LKDVTEPLSVLSLLRTARSHARRKGICLRHYADLWIMPMSALNVLVVAVPTGREVGIIAGSTGRS
jgi:hypothetical protein